ncbi:MAG: ABC transporter permease [Candidatus Hydrogenedentes bacterium]|nr:ABC transporter permease [Candidatus Hydrogenedentota bacterium]
MAQSPSQRRPRLDFQLFMPAIAIIKRELLSTLRDRRYFRVMAFALLMLLIALVFLFRGDPIDMTDPRAMRELSTFLFLGYAYTLYAIAMLLVPTVASNAICSEKQQEQLDLIRMSYISPAVFLLGKAANILGLYLLTVIATLHFAGVMFFFTGIDWMQYLQVLFLIFMAAASATAVGLLCSAYCYRTIPAAICTYLLVLLTQGSAVILSLLALAALLENIPTPSWMFSDWPFAFLDVAIPCMGILHLASNSANPIFFLFVAGYHGGIIVTCGFLAHRLLNCPTTPSPSSTEVTR